MRITSRLMLMGCLLLVPPAAPGVEPPALAKQAQAVLTTHCYRCHGQDGANEGGLNFILDRQKLVQRKKIVPGDPAKSKLYQRAVSASNPMPPEEETKRPGQQELNVLRLWIEAGAPDFLVTSARRAFVSQADVLKHLRADLDSLSERDRRFTRYLTLTHLYNAGLADDELQSFRHGLAKLVNSLSWGRRVVVPRSIDPARTIYRLDLRDYQWNEQIWDAVLAAYPYGVTSESAVGAALAADTRCRLPHVRADWFVAAAARPPLYHDVLQLPATERELEKLLRVDTAENLRQERVVRAGFNSSGVSRNNRLIERHESGHVIYWKSYDFAGNTGRQNLFVHPLGPGTANSFQHDGGEIIFTLPNGLQGYYLADAQGRRLSKGPTAIVSDPRRPDRAVENGLSCMSCHARGIIEKQDQVRDHVLKNPQAFRAADRDSILALYPPREQLLAHMREDAKRFRAAVEQTGSPWSATEPIAALALRFEAELDLTLAAAEAGVEPKQLLHALEQVPELAKLLGPLKVEGGTIQREVFVEAFARLVRNLQLGEQLATRASAYAELLRRGQRLVEAGDNAGAMKALSDAIILDPGAARAYQQRASLRHDSRDFTGAVADYTEALRRDSGDAVTVNNRGLAYLEQRDFTRALADFTEAVRLDPRYVVALRNRGLAHQRRNEVARAIADFTEALRLDPEYVAAYHSRAAAHHQGGAYAQAVADYTEAVRRDPRSAVLINNRGLAYYEQREYTKALADFTAALTLDPRFAVGFYNRGLAHDRAGKLTEAVADFTEALRLDPKFARAYLQRGETHRKQGDAARAAADRTEALRLDPTLKD